MAGVLRDRKFGQPVGTYELYDYARASAKHVTRVASSSDAINDTQVDQTYQKVSKTFAMSAQTVEEAGDQGEFVPTLL